MPRGSKDAYTDKQKRQAAHIEAGYVEDGVPREEAEARAWATVNRQDGGGKKSGSGRGKPRNTKKTGRKTASRKTTKKTATKKKATKKKATKKKAAKKATAKKKATKKKTAKTTTG